MLCLLCGQEYPIWCSLLCITDFQGGEVCWEDPKYVWREGQAKQSSLWGQGWSWTYLHRAFKLKSTRIRCVHDAPQCSSLSMMLMCLQRTIGTVLQHPPRCKFHLKLWISSFVAMWHENQTKENNDSNTDGTGQPTCCQCSYEFLWLSVAIVYPLLWLFGGGGERGTWAYVESQQWNSSADPFPVSQCVVLPLLSVLCAQALYFPAALV